MVFVRVHGSSGARMLQPVPLSPAWSVPLGCSAGPNQSLLCSPWGIVLVRVVLPPAALGAEPSPVSPGLLGALAALPSRSAARWGPCPATGATTASQGSCSAHLASKPSAAEEQEQPLADRRFPSPAGPTVLRAVRERPAGAQAAPGKVGIELGTRG